MRIVAEQVANSRYPSTRETARRLVESVRAAPKSETVVLDFLGINVASRSFVSELLTRLSELPNRIEFANLSPAVAAVVEGVRSSGVRREAIFGSEACICDACGSVQSVAKNRIEGESVRAACETCGRQTLRLAGPRPPTWVGYRPA